MSRASGLKINSTEEDKERATLFSIEVKDANYLRRGKRFVLETAGGGREEHLFVTVLDSWSFLVLPVLQASLLSLMKHDLLY